MPGSDRPNVLTIAQSVPGAWPTIPALMRLMSSQATFEPVSAKTQPVSGHTTCQIPDIENSCGRDSSRKTPPSVGSPRFSSPKTRPLPANPRECRRFSHTLEITPQRPHWLADDAVSIGLVSTANSLLTGKLTGNFVDSGPLPRFLRPVGERIQWLAEKFPTQRNREFLEALQGIILEEQGFF